MSKRIGELQNLIAGGIWDVMPKHKWSQASFTAMAISQYFQAIGRVEAEQHPVSGVNSVGSSVLMAFRELRTEMSRMHEIGHAWYTATFTLTPDGKFKFDFDYDHLPTFDIMPSPDKWLDEFKHYPRLELQAQIQDWIDGKIGYDDAGHAEIIERLRKLAS